LEKDSHRLRKKEPQGRVQEKYHIRFPSRTRREHPWEEGKGSPLLALKGPFSEKAGQWNLGGAGRFLTKASAVGEENLREK